MSAPEPALADFLHCAGLAGEDEDGEWTPLTGGVSSDIWRVDTRRGSICVKRALAQLNVAAEWKAPVERNAFEWAYMQVAAIIVPGAVPAPLAHDEARGLFAMAWLDATRHRLWKAELLANRIDSGVAESVGALIGKIHSATARDPDIPSKFATDASFHAIRIEPYLLETAKHHPDLAARLHAIANVTETTRHALVHGDVSPKNIMVGLDGPVLLDAECAWFGDPAFDLAFCLNHLAIKARVVDGARARVGECFNGLAEAYLSHVDWEDRAAVESRAADLLPALALARVDGKSPVEYLSEFERSTLRVAARAAVIQRPTSLAQAFAILTA